MTMRYRLGLDLGTNSLGWAVIELSEKNEPARIERIGSRIFPSGRHPKDDSSLAVARRGPRQMRRRRDRYLRRREIFIAELVRAGLFPPDKAGQQALVTLNPYRLRSDGLHRKLLPFELGRALFHLQQRRGFKSNRKTDKASADPEKETSKLKLAIQEFAAGLEKDSTVGAALWTRIQNGQTARARLIGSGPKATYTLYVGRDMVEHEFDALWKAQEQWHPRLLTEEAKSQLKQVLLFQRELLPQEVGTCFFERADKRAPMALPSSQKFRLYQEVNHLRARNLSTMEERSLTRSERDAVMTKLLAHQKVTFASLRKIVFEKESRYWQFSIEDDRRSDLKGDQVSAQLSKEEAFGERWHAFEAVEQDRVVERLLEESNELAVVDWLSSEFSLTEAQAQYVSDLSFPNGHLRIGRIAISKILPQLIDGWDDELDHALSYDQAVLTAGYRSHSQTHDGTLHDALPYYGEILYRYTMPASKAVGDEKTFGKIGNPTVHIGLNQVRIIVNAIIAKYGLPTQVVLEVARDLKNSQEDKKRINAQQKKNQDDNDRIRKELARLGQTDNFDNRLRLRLYNELRGTPKSCVYSGRVISVSSLFSNEYQVDHILPLSKTLDDSFSNKVLVHNSANRYKGNRSPFEAFGLSLDGYNWDDVLDRAQSSLPVNKQRRFSSEAMIEAGEAKDFLARQLNDTAYLARVSKQYLEAVCPDVWVTPGRLTGLLRGKWHLNSILSDSGKKERTDHRHHAIDAAVIAVTDRGLLNRVSCVAALAKDRDLDRAFDTFPDPWESFREELIGAAQRVVIAHKPNHGTGSRLHNDTAYGIVSGPDASGKYRVRHRIDLTSVREKHLKDLDVSTGFRDQIEEAILAASGEAAIAKNLGDLAEKTGRRAVRLEETLSVVPIYAKGQSSLEGAEPYKAYKGDSNYCYEIFRTENDKWDGRVVSSFEANGKDYQAFRSSSRFRTQAWSGEPLIMRIMSDDMVAIEENGARRIMRVQKVSPGKVYLAGHLEGNVDARSRDKESGFAYTQKSPNSLKAVNARRVFVDPMGNVLDPGFTG